MYVFFPNTFIFHINRHKQVNKTIDIEKDPENSLHRSSVFFRDVVVDVEVENFIISVVVSVFDDFPLDDFSGSGSFTKTQIESFSLVRCRH